MKFELDGIVYNSSYDVNPARRWQPIYDIKDDTCTDANSDHSTCLTSTDSFSWRYNPLEKSLPKNSYELRLAGLT